MPTSRAAVIAKKNSITTRLRTASVNPPTQQLDLTAYYEVRTDAPTVTTHTTLEKTNLAVPKRTGLVP